MMYKLYLILKFNNANVDDHTISLATAIWGQTEVPASSAELSEECVHSEQVWVSSPGCDFSSVIFYTLVTEAASHFPALTEPGFAMAGLPSC